MAGTRQGRNQAGKTAGFLPGALVYQEAASGKRGAWDGSEQGPPGGVFSPPGSERFRRGVHGVGMVKLVRMSPRGKARLAAGARRATLLKALLNMAVEAGKRPGTICLKWLRVRVPNSTEGGQQKAPGLPRSPAPEWPLPPPPPPPPPPARPRKCAGNRLGRDSREGSGSEQSSKCSKRHEEEQTGHSGDSRNKT